MTTWGLHKGFPVKHCRALRGDGAVSSHPRHGVTWTWAVAPGVEDSTGATLMCW